MKPILFNTEDVQAILDDRKSTSREVIRCDLYDSTKETAGDFELCDRKNQLFFKNKEHFKKWALRKCRYKVGDILYVKETWQDLSNNEGEYVYFADGDEGLEDKGWGVITTKDIKWRPSIHMPRKAARIFLKVTGVRAERLQDMCVADCVHEGVEVGNAWTVNAKPNFIKLWNSTIKKQDLDIYSWEANPWVRVIEFEREGDLNERRRP